MHGPPQWASDYVGKNLSYLFSRWEQDASCVLHVSVETIEYMLVESSLASVSSGKALWTSEKHVLNVGKICPHFRRRKKTQTN